MPEHEEIYRRMYTKLFNAVTDAEKLIHKADIILKTAQIECEEMYLEEDPSALV